MVQVHFLFCVLFYFSIFHPWTVNVAERCQQQLKLRGLRCQWESREGKVWVTFSHSLCVCVYLHADARFAGAALDDSAPNHSHFAGINGRQTASNERRNTRVITDPEAPCLRFQSSLNLPLCPTLAETLLLLLFMFIVFLFFCHEPLPHKLRIFTKESLDFNMECSRC